VSKPGPKPKLDDEKLRARVLDLVKAGSYIETAAEAAGIARRTFYDYLRLHPDFQEQLHEASATSMATAAALVTKAGSKQWQAAAWMLERKDPARWGQRIHFTVQQELEKILRVVEAHVDETTFERILGELAAGDRRELAVGTPRAEEADAGER
jgi:hypothetical protein